MKIVLLLLLELVINVSNLVRTMDAHRFGAILLVILVVTNLYVLSSESKDDTCNCVYLSTMTTHPL